MQGAESVQQGATLMLGWLLIALAAYLALCVLLELASRAANRGDEHVHFLRAVWGRLLALPMALVVSVKTIMEKKK